jgi:hypothetical protein
MLKRRLASTFLTITVVVFIAITFSPSISTELWHVRHQGQIHYAGVRFQAPSGWSARVGPSAAHFEKRPKTVFSRSVLMAWASVAPVPNPPRSTREREEFYSNFAALYSTYLAADQEIEEKPIRLGTGEREAFCMQSTLKNRTNWFRTTCLVWRGTWSASFEGPQEQKEQFFREVLGLPDPRPKEEGTSQMPGNP